MYIYYKKMISIFLKTTKPRTLWQKMRNYTFVTEEETKTIEALSYKKAVKSFQVAQKIKL